MVLAFQPGSPGSNPVRTLYFCHAFINFFLRYELCSKELHQMDLQVTRYYVALTMEFVFGEVKSKVGKGEDAGYKNILLFEQCF